jgi:hypothetical protein
MRENVPFFSNAPLRARAHQHNHRRVNRQRVRPDRMRRTEQPE